MNLKQWLTGARTEHTWTCFECLFPPCCLCPGDARPLHGIKHNALVDGKYYCMQHRYPPRSGPGCTSGPNGGPATRRAHRVPVGTIRLKSWTCPTCAKKAPTCAKEAQRVCGECEGRTASLAFRREKNGDIAKRFRACEFPCCQACGRQRREAARSELHAPAGPPVRWYHVRGRLELSQAPLQEHAPGECQRSRAGFLGLPESCLGLPGCFLRLPESFLWLPQIS